jgi:hypothetical protein
MLHEKACVVDSHAMTIAVRLLVLVEIGEYVADGAQAQPNVSVDFSYLEQTLSGHRYIASGVLVRRHSVSRFRRRDVRVPSAAVMTHSHQTMFASTLGARRLGQNPAIRSSRAAPSIRCEKDERCGTPSGTIRRHPVVHGVRP